MDTTLKHITRSAIAALLAAPAAHAASLTWDKTSGDGATITPGSGTWDLSSLFWNNAGANPNLAWTQTNTTTATNSATFAGADGTVDSYVVTLGSQMAATAVAFNNTGYKLTGSTLYFYNTADGATVVSVAANKTATINSAISGSGYQNNMSVGSGATLNLAGNMTSIQPLLGGGGTVNMTAGTWTTGGFFELKGCAFNQSGGSITQTGGSAGYIGYGGNSTYTISGGTFTNNGANVAMSRGGYTANLTLKSGGALNVGTGTTTANLYLASSDNNANEKSYVDVQGGTLTVGSAAAATPGSIGMMNLTAGAAATQVASFIVEGGVVNAWGGFQFGAASGTFTAGAAASLTLSSGFLYLGAGGLVENAAHPTDTVTFSGGTLGALADWGSAMSMGLGSGGGPVTIQAADAGSVAHNITLSGALSGSQGLSKTGAGMLTLSGVNHYTGLTTVSAGKLRFSTAGSATSPVTVAANATVGVVVATAGGQWVNTGDLTSQASSILNIDYNSTAPSTTTAPIKVANFTPATGVALSVSGAFATGQVYPLVTWTGSGPVDASAFTTLVLPNRVAGSLSVSGSTLILTVTAAAEPLTWNTGNGNWDTTTTTSWVDNTAAAATFMDGGLDQVVFGDASGATGNPTVTLNSTLSPAAVTMKSTSHNYTISGSGAIGGGTSLVLDAANTKTLTLANRNTYTGGTVVTGGTLQVNGSAFANPAQILPANKDLTISGATVSLLGQWNSIFNSSAGTLTLNAGGTLSDDKTGIGHNLFAVVLNGGTLAGSGNPDPNVGDFTIASGISATADSLISARISRLSGAAGVDVSAGKTLTISGRYQNAVTLATSALTKTGPGTLILSAANTYTGATTVSQGTLALVGGSQASPVTLSAGASLGFTLGSPTTSTSNFNLTAGTIKITGTPTLSSYTLITSSAGITGTPTLDTPITGYTLQVASGNSLKLVASFSAWQAANHTSGGLNEDHDNDGVPNGIEYFLGGNTNTTGFTALPGVTHTAGTLSVTWTKGSGYAGIYSTDYAVETSATLNGAWQVETLGGGHVTDAPGYVTYTFPAGTRNFVRLKVTGP